jgi:ABC-type antimicrobial peptide transport system permease subunit
VLGVGSVFGLSAYAANVRRREFGIRMALGATPIRLIRRAAIGSLAPVAAGACLGLLGASLVTRLAESLLIGIGHADTATYGLVGAVMIGSAFLGAFLAASRIRHLSPIDVLRTE